MQQSSSTVRAPRNADQTRQRILEAAFMEIYRNGFQGMRLDEVLATTSLTKGALYHHFSNKQALGYAVVDEVIQQIVQATWIQPLRGTDAPLQTLIDVIEQLPDNKPPEMIQYGCPLNNLAQEMSPLDEGFRQRLDKVFRAWHGAIREALEKARQQGQIRADCHCDEIAMFVMAALEGCIGLAKSAQSKERLTTCNRGLIQFLMSLKVQ
ncbi:Transcriptional regulator, AcrR family [hydrothermal vent metagenome]|uniref:Transcriptional regulator, AcrR family n=1 Tax=hydrothermal vent metagenome TaxID=652676 RepID=A0A3B0YQ10_9ZZZZ